MATGNILVEIKYDMDQTRAYFRQIETEWLFVGRIYTAGERVSGLALLGVK